MPGMPVSSFTAHALLSRRNHNQNGLSIEARMRQPATDLTAFLAKGKGMAAQMSGNITEGLTLFLILFSH